MCMKIRPYHVWAFLVVLPAASAWRVYERARIELAVPRQEFANWVRLTRMTTEALDRDVAHRYEHLARDLDGERDVGYFSERDASTLWSEAPTPGVTSRIYRYYMAQGSWRLRCFALMSGGR